MSDPVPYCGSAPAPWELLLRWNFDPAVLTGLGLAAGLAVILPRSVGVRRPVLAAAVSVLAVAFVSPLCALSSALFSARVAHHALLVAAAAPLLALALPHAPARPLGLWSAGLLHAALFWFWHAPPAYAAALSQDALYWTMQLSLLGPAVLFWRAVREAPPLAASGALLGFMMQMGLLGALITFAPRPLYAPHLFTTEVWGLSALQDQQLGGLIMWAPMAGLYLLAALALVSRTLGRDAQGAAA